MRITGQTRDYVREAPASCTDVRGRGKEDLQRSPLTDASLGYPGKTGFQDFVAYTSKGIRGEGQKGSRWYFIPRVLYYDIRIFIIIIIITVVIIFW